MAMPGDGEIPFLGLAVSLPHPDFCSVFESNGVKNLLGAVYPAFQLLRQLLAEE